MFPPMMRSRSSSRKIAQKCLVHRQNDVHSLEGGVAAVANAISAKRVDGVENGVGLRFAIDNQNIRVLCCELDGSGVKRG